MTVIVSEGGQAGWESSFERWCSAMADLELVDLCPVTEDPEVRRRLMSVFADNGDLPGPVFGRMLFDHRMKSAQEALDQLIAAYEHETGVRVQVLLQFETPSATYLAGFVKVDAAYVFGITEADVVCDVARGFQDVVQETVRRVWPVCPDHGCGVHSEVFEGRAVETLLYADEKAFFELLLPEIGADLGLRAIRSMYLTPDQEARAKRVLALALTPGGDGAGTGRSAPAG